MLARLVSGWGRRLVAVILCAAAAHAVAYGSLWPTDGVHGYFMWYAPLAAGVSAISLLGLPLALAIGLATGRNNWFVCTAKWMLPARRPNRRVSGEAGGLASAALVFLLAQESLERSLEAGRFEIQSFSVQRWLALAATLLVVGLVIALIERGISSLATVFGARRRPGALADAGDRLRAEAEFVARRVCPLALHAGLRAPPAFS
jgi:hypothetical protein